MMGRNPEISLAGVLNKTLDILVVFLDRLIFLTAKFCSVILPIGLSMHVFAFHYIYTGNQIALRTVDLCALRDTLALAVASVSHSFAQPFIFPLSGLDLYHELANGLTRTLNIGQMSRYLNQTVNVSAVIYHGPRQHVHGY